MPKRNEKYTGEFSVNNQLYFCGIPFRLDSYSGCSHNCLYCFARANEITNASTISRGTTGIVPADPKYFKRLLALAHRWEGRNDINVEWLRHKVPIHFGSMSDPFQPCEEKYKVSWEYMDYLSYYQYPTVISTKAPSWLLKPEYRKLLLEGKYAIQVSLVGDDDRLIGQLEPNAPSTSKRLRAIEELSELGIWVAVRIQPVIPSTVLEDRLPEFVSRLANIGVKHILAEGYKASWMSDRTQDVWRLFPQVYREYQYPDVAKQAHERVLPAWRKWKYVKVLIEAAHENGLTFGAADNDLRDLGDTICCCGIDNIPGFENFWRYQASQAAKVAQAQGYVDIGDMEQYWSGGNAMMDTGNLEGYEEYTKSRALLTHTQDSTIRKLAYAQQIEYTAKWCVDYSWSYGGPNSPEMMVSMKRSQRDGELVYEYRDPIPLLESSQVEQLTML